MPSVQPLDLSEAVQRIHRARAVLIDLNGGLVFGRQLAPGAAAFVARAGERLTIVSNDSTLTPTGLSAKLKGLGLSIPPERIFAAGKCAIDTLAAEAPRTRVLALVAAPLRGYALAAGLRLASHGVDIVLLGCDLDLSYGRLRSALQALHAGARLVLCNPDLTHPEEDRQPVPDTGLLAAALLGAVPGAPMSLIGKPSPMLLELALARLGAVAKDAVMIGDTAETDGEAAAAIGLPFILVGPPTQASLADLVADR